MTLLAHKDADGNVQTLYDHLHNAGDLAEAMNRSSLRFHGWQRSCMMLERSRNSFKRI